MNEYCTLCGRPLHLVTSSFISVLSTYIFLSTLISGSPISHQLFPSQYDMQRNDTGGAAAAQSNSIRAVRNSTSERPSTPPRQEQQHHPHFQYHNQTHQQQQNPSISRMANSSNSIRELKSPYQLLAESGSMETVRQRNVKNLLGDFFSM